MEDLTYNLIVRSLKAAELRQQVIAHNIANVNTAGFKRSEVAFEDILNQKLDKGASLEDLTKVEPEVVKDNSTSMRLDGNNVDIDIEMSNMAANNILYNTLITQLNSKIGIMRLVINGGR